MQRRPLRRPEALPDPGTSRCDQGGMRLARNPRADLDRCLGAPRLERLSRTWRSDEPFASARRQGSLRGGDATPPWSTRRWSLLKRIAARPGEISGRYVTGHDRRMAPRKEGGEQSGIRRDGPAVSISGRRGATGYYPRRAVKDGRAWMFPGCSQNHTVGSCQPSFSNLYSAFRGAGGARTHDRRIMRSLSGCSGRTTCTDTTEPRRRDPDRTVCPGGSVHEPVHGKALSLPSCYCA